MSEDIISIPPRPRPALITGHDRQARPAGTTTADKHRPPACASTTALTHRGDAGATGAGGWPGGRPRVPPATGRAATTAKLRVTKWDIPPPGCPAARRHARQRATGPRGTAPETAMTLPLPALPLTLLVLLAVSLPAQHLLIEQQANQIVSDSITESTQAANATAARLFVNEVYPRLAPRLGLEAGGAAPKALADGDLAETDRTVRRFMLGTDILKVKLYALNGLTIYSTEPAQIGQDQSKNPAVISATQGIPGSQITHRGKFSAMEGEVFEKDLVASYIPLRTATGAVIGVAEIYTDRTPVISRALGGEGRLHPFLLVANVIQFLLLAFLAWSIYTHLARPADDETPRR